MGVCVCLGLVVVVWVGLVGGLVVRQSGRRRFLFCLSSVGLVCLSVDLSGGFVCLGLSLSVSVALYLSLSFGLSACLSCDWFSSFGPSARGLSVCPCFCPCLCLRRGCFE